MIPEVVGNHIRLQVLYLLWRSHPRPLIITQLYRKIGCAANSADKATRDLQDLGLVERDKAGQQVNCYLRSTDGLLMESLEPLFKNWTRIEEEPLIPSGDAP